MGIFTKATKQMFFFAGRKKSLAMSRIAVEPLFFNQDGLLSERETLQLQILKIGKSLGHWGLEIRKSMNQKADQSKKKKLRRHWLLG